MFKINFFNMFYVTKNSFVFLGMLENFSYLVNTVGLIPNGNRIYYTRRSQPPLFIAMVEEYFKVTRDKDFLMQVRSNQFPPPKK